MAKKLRRAVKAVGCSAAAVEDFVGRVIAAEYERLTRKAAKRGRRGK